MKNEDTDYLMDVARKVVEQAYTNAAAEKIQVVIVEPMLKPYKKTIVNTLAAMNDIVGGYIENVMIGTVDSGSTIFIILNEDGRRLNLPFNRHIIGFDNLVGTFFITACNLEGDNVSLTDEETDRYIKLFTPVEAYL